MPRRRPNPSAAWFRKVAPRGDDFRTAAEILAHRTPAIARHALVTSYQATELDIPLGIRRQHAATVALDGAALVAVGFAINELGWAHYYHLESLDAFERVERSAARVGVYADRWVEVLEGRYRGSRKITRVLPDESDDDDARTLAAEMVDSVESSVIDLSDWDRLRSAMDVFIDTGNELIDTIAGGILVTTTYGDMLTWKPTMDKPFPPHMR